MTIGKALDILVVFVPENKYVKSSCPGTLGCQDFFTKKPENSFDQALRKLEENFLGGLRYECTKEHYEYRRKAFQKYGGAKDGRRTDAEGYGLHICTKNPQRDV